MKKQKGNAIIGLLALMIILTVGVSWVWNFVKLTDCDFNPSYRCEVIHGLGIIPILAPVTVWFATDKDSK